VKDPTIKNQQRVKKRKRRKTYQGRQKLLTRGYLGLTHCLNRGPNGGNIAANSYEVGGGGFLILEGGHSQSFLPLWRGLLAGIPTHENSELGRSPNDCTPKGLLVEDQRGISKLMLGAKQLTACRGQAGGNVQKISTQK
jgi:hypothetical protein